MAINAVNWSQSKKVSSVSWLLRGSNTSSGQQLTAIDNAVSEDRQLVELTLRGDVRAYESLVRRYQKLVYNVLYQMLQSHEAAADTTQDAFLKAYKALPTFKTGAPFKPWLLRIATNSGLNKLRYSRSHQHDSLDDLLDEQAMAEPASKQNVEKEIELKLSHKALIEALSQLPPRHRHIFVLRYQHDLSYAEIAEITEETETTIKSLLFRTREKLRKLLETEINA